MYFVATHQSASPIDPAALVSARVTNAGNAFAGKAIAGDYRVVISAAQNSGTRGAYLYAGEGTPPSASFARALVVHFDATSDMTINFAGTPTD